MGGMHVHLEIVFDDGTVWLARLLRENYTSFSDELSNSVLLSECATLRWLESINIPTPRLYGYGLRDRQNPVGVAYMLIEKLPGQPFNPHAASEEQRSCVLSQWARILSSLAKHPFEKAGSLIFIEAFLMFGHLLHRIDNGAWLDRWSEHNSGPFFLKHADDKGDHILVDDNFRITGIIDWTFAKVVPAYEAFGPSLVSANNTDLFSGNAGLSPEDRILGQRLRSELDFCFFDSDEMRRFLFGLGMGLALSKREAIATFQAIVKTFQGETLDWDSFQTSSWRASRFQKCSLPDCQEPGVRNRSCVVCERHLCAIHIQPRYHKCPSMKRVDDATWENNIKREVEALLASINVRKLVEVAESLRGGTKCTFEPGRYLGPGAMMGCANFHGWINFHDGVQWIARFPRTTSFSDVPSDLVEYLVQSEYATLKWLEELKIPTPRAHGFGLASDLNNLVGASYLLEDALPGKVYNSYTASAEQKFHVYKQYAAVLSEISKHGLDQACSLLPGGITGPIASNRFVTLGIYGPFHSPREYFTSVAESHIELIADGQLYPEYPKEACLFYRLLRDQAAAVLSPIEMDHRFFLKHVDDKGDHILVDEDYNITGIIDWQFARFVPASEAFSPSLFTADMSMLYKGIPGLGPNDKEFSKLLDSGFASNELARRFNFGLTSGLKRNEVLRMIGAVLCLLDRESEDKETGDREMSDEELEAWVTEEWRLSSGETWNGRVRELLENMQLEPNVA
ncbi:hypothetical protein B0I35DRAFT_382249 [Stachybotrys elegans]|uniref:Aminoglycoside phosphotransferase domain-containing protein n=1 Tax=Stachybotrys elegans TaxID=80388 RepID=A0A8K0SCY9_9HYPO|nr:hypothetical protein B0I35DRAFT_382249 [Stachybotrys elegans]